VANLFKSVSTLSSARPEVSALFKMRFFSYSSSTTKCRIPARSIESPITAYQLVKLSIPRGNPSIRNFFVAQPCFSIAALISRQGISPGTSAPAFIILLIISPFSEPLATSSLNKSPAERCMKPKLATSFAHYVPLPEPGPPRTNKTIGLSCSDFIILIYFTD